MSNHKSTESTIKDLEIQVGQLAKQITEKSSSTFGANTEQNPKEECKAVMTRGRMATMIEDKERTPEDNQELLVVEEEEDEKETEGNQLGEDTINKNKKEINVEEKEETEKEKQKENENEKKSEKEEKRKTKSELAREKKKRETSPSTGK